ncbi:hypothetical protein ACQJBY_004098 [Aegilops geniculata]
MRKGGAWPPGRIHGICGSWAERRMEVRERRREKGGRCGVARRSGATVDGRRRWRDLEPAGRATPTRPVEGFGVARLDHQKMDHNYEPIAIQVFDNRP